MLYEKIKPVSFTLCTKPYDNKIHGIMNGEIELLLYQYSQNNFDRNRRNRFNYRF